MPASKQSLSAIIADSSEDENDNFPKFLDACALSNARRHLIHGLEPVIIASHNA
jgi:hypothetical protein